MSDVRCKNCGAALTAAEGAASVTCSYCGATTRSGAAAKVAKAAAMAAPTAAEVALETAPRPRNTGGRVLAIAVLVFALGAVWLVVKIVSSAGRSDDPKPAAVAEPPGQVARDEDHWEWQGTGPVLLADADGDGVDDIIGRLRYMRAGDSIRIAALSGVTGAPLWKTASIGSYSDSYQGPLLQGRKNLVHVDTRAMVRGLDLATGRVLWSFQASDALRTACRGEGEGDRLLLELEDRTWIDLDLVDGTSRPGAKPAACAQLPRDDEELDAEITSTWRDLEGAPIEGMAISRVLRRGDGPEIAVGARDPGTHVPMLARRDAGQVTWKVVVPAGNPMDAAGLQFEVVTVTPADVCAVYLIKDRPPRVTCFDIETGTRRWDIEMATDGKGGSVSPRALIARGGKLYLTSVGHLQIHDLATGERVKIIGDL